MRTIPSCDVCAKVRNDVRRFALSREGRGQGAIDLCERCWDRIGKPNMRPGRATRWTKPLEQRTPFSG